MLLHIYGFLGLACGDLGAIILPAIVMYLKTV